MSKPNVESDHFVHQAVVKGDADTVSRYLASGGSANVLDGYGCEPLFTAVKYDQLEIAEMLLAAGGNIFNHSHFKGHAFGAACWNLNTRMIDFCLGAGVDINERVRGETALDSLIVKKKFLPAEAFEEWQAIYDKLVGLGAVHAK